MVNSKIIRITLLISIVIIFSCIDKFDKKLKLVNDTKKNFFQIVKEDTTLLISDVNYIDTNSVHRVLKSDDILYPIFAFKNHGGYTKKINEQCLDSTMYLYLFEIDSVKKYHWNSIIKKESMFIKKGFKVKDLDSMRWVIKINSLIRNKTGS